MLRIGLLLTFSGIALGGFGQEKDSTANNTLDSAFISKTPAIDTIHSYSSRRFDPRKALLFAAVLPGSGQIYNKKYWKVPLVYGGFGLLIYAANFYQQAYVQYKDELYMTINDPGATPPSGLSQDQLRLIVDEARRQRDYMYVFTGLLYILQIVDAHVDAHLKEFDLNPKLRVQVQPQSTYDAMMGRSTGVKLVLKF